MEEFFRARSRTTATVAGFMNPPPPSSVAASTTTVVTTTAGADSDLVRVYYTPNFHPLAKHRPFHLDITSQTSSSSSSGDHIAAMKSKIVSHPRYLNLVASYVGCQMVGAPQDVASRLSAAAQEVDTRQRAEFGCRVAPNDPELDQFMEAYQQLFDKYKGELMKSLQESTEFINNQLNSITNASFGVLSTDGNDHTCTSEEDHNDQVIEIDPQAEDRELKNHLLKKYSGYLGNLRKELSKKKKKGKLPKEARQKLLNWWELHYKWPYPSETEKMTLLDSTGLDQKQINNWFINQRKRHWKPSEDMQFMAADGFPYHPPTANIVYVGRYMTDDVLPHVTPRQFN